MANQLRNWLITVNNPTETDEQFYEYCKKLNHLKYFVFQREKGEKEGTEHFQLYIEFQVGKTFNTMKEYFPRAHIEKREGTKKQARKYCMKEDTRISEKPFEYGDFVEIGERSDINDVIQMAKENIDDMEILEAYPAQYFKNYAAVSHVKQLAMSKKFGNVFREMEVTYIWGEKRVGKSSYVFKKHGYENVYRLSGYDVGSWDEYKGEDVVMFDDYHSDFPISKFLQLLEGHPYRLSSRYSNKWACFTKVYVVSNIPIEKQYEKLKLEDFDTWDAFRARFNKILHLKKDGEQTSIDDLPKLQEDTALPF